MGKETSFGLLCSVLNSPHTSAILFEALGYQLQFSQDPNSKHLGTTVWDASMVLVKFLEKNCRKGRFRPSKLKGKRVIELGAGCGVAGFDQTEVLPLLMRNVERNTSRVTQMNPDSDSFGSIKVAELNWGDEDQIKAVEPPFDYIIGTDVVYAEHLLEPLLQTILALSGPKTTILLGYEIRSTNVHEKMLELWKRNFEVKTVPKAKMDSNYQHPSIQLFIMSLKPSVESAESIAYEPAQKAKLSGSRELKNGSDEEDDDDNSSKADEDDLRVNEVIVDDKLVVDLENRKLSEWETRSYGAIAARLLRDIKIT
nr:protein N-lysine methyltransferase METTL21A isoform X1 [Ipomoea batatas]